MTGLSGGSQGRERKAMPNAVSSLESEIRAGAVSALRRRAARQAVEAQAGTARTETGRTYRPEPSTRICPHPRRREMAAPRRALQAQVRRRSSRSGAYRVCGGILRDANEQ
jgi:hypothetical protein